MDTEDGARRITYLTVVGIPVRLSKRTYHLAPHGGCIYSKEGVKYSIPPILLNNAHHTRPSPSHAGTVRYGRVRQC